MSKTGRMAVYHGKGKPFEIREYPVPKAGPGAILVKITMASICGSDLHMWRGDIDFAAMGLPMPRVMGHEAIGRVAELGEGVTTDSTGQPLAVGDRIVWRYFYPCGRCPACLRGDTPSCASKGRGINSAADAPPHFTGVYGEYYYLQPNHAVFKVPDDVTDDMAASVNCALCQVIYGLEKVRLSFGETIVIQGAGGLGINATAVAKESGAHKVIVIDGIKDRLDLAKAFGADEVIDMKEFKTPQERVQRVMKLTGGWGADVVAELVGFPSAIPEGLAMVANGGRYLEMGNISRGMTLQWDPAMIVYGSKSIVGVLMYADDTIKKALDLLSRTKGKYPFEKIVSRKYPLEQIDIAFQNQDKGLVSRSAIVP